MVSDYDHAFFSPKIELRSLYGTPYIVISDAKRSATIVLNHEVNERFRVIIDRATRKLN